MKAPTIRVDQLLRRMTITVRITGLRRARWRIRVGRLLLIAGARVVGAKLDVIANDEHERMIQ